MSLDDEGERVAKADSNANNKCDDLSAKDDENAFGQDTTTNKENESSGVCVCVCVCKMEKMNVRFAVH